jgi:hypothetical protein
MPPPPAPADDKPIAFPLEDLYQYRKVYWERTGWRTGG